MSKVALMCGHGRSTDGTWDSGTAYAGKTEAGLMLPITRAAVKYLRSYGVEVISDADTGNNKNMIADVKWANSDKDVVAYVSVHCDYYKAPSGVMPLYVSTVAGKKLATALNNAIVKGMGMKSRGVVRRTDLYELNYTDMPACILETGSVKADINYLTQSDKYGKCIAQGICDYLGIKAEEPLGKLSVDGKGGKKTVKRMQEFFGTEVDGVISGQNKDLSKYYPNLISVEFGGGGSPCVKKLQKWVGANEDGVLGQITVKLWQKKIGVTQDGIFGEDSMKAWQKYLNEHDKATYPTVTKPATTPTVSKPTTSTSTGAAKIVAKAKEFAWTYGTAAKTYSYKTGSAKSAYKTALKKYMKKTAKVSQTDCGYFVSTCVRASGVSSSFLALPASYKNSYPAVPSTMQIVSKGKVGTLQAGDIIRYRKSSGQHTVIYIGDGLIAHASRKHAFPRIAKSKPWTNSNVKKSTIQVIRAK